MAHINFETQDLKVDYFSFNFQFNDFNRIQEIAEYLSNNFQCNSILKDKNYPDRIQTLVNKDRNHYKVEFRVNYIDYWNGTTIIFKGNQAQRFYTIIRSNPLDWDIMDFENTSIGRFDLCFDRKLILSDRGEDLNTFIERSNDTNNSKPGNLTSKADDDILWVGNRKSNYYFRVYKKPNGREIRFELEIKKTGIKKFQYYLFSNQFQVFEELMVKQFYKQSLNSFIHDSCYTDWLMSKFRKTKKVNIKTNPLIGTYLKQIIFACEEYLYRFFQLLSYLQDPQNYVELETITIRRQSYKVVSFPVNHFLEFTGKKKNNYYQMNKLIDFLTSLQRLPPIVDSFMDAGFKSVVAFPYIELDRREKQYVRIALTQELYYYNYPFHFPKQFLNDHGIYDLKIKIFIIQSFAIYELKKELRVQDFLQQFHISNSKNLKLRKDILKIMQQLQDQKFIKSQFIIKNKQQKKTEVTKLTLKLIAQSESIFYFENIQQNYF